jgi:hypothetical protein
MGKHWGRKKKMTFKEKREKAKNPQHQERSEFEKFTYENIYYEQYYKVPSFPTKKIFLVPNRV